MMPSRPEYIAAWLGISKVGGIVALINTKLVGTSLSHCINIAGARRHVIVASELRAMFSEPRRLISSPPAANLALMAAVTNYVARQASMSRWIGWMEAPLPSALRPEVTINDPALLVYTSGTTGLPKAARISHRRIMNWGYWFAGLTAASPQDRLV